MAVDTATKRYSALNVGCPWRGPAAIPSGTIGDSPRAIVAWLYSGFDYAADDGAVWAFLLAIAGTAISDDGIMGTIFLDDATAVPDTHVKIPPGIAHHQDGRRYVALWPADNDVHYRGEIACRDDGAMLIDPSGTRTQDSNGTALTYRGEVIATTSDPEIWIFGFGHRGAGEMCMSDIA